MGDYPNSKIYVVFLCLAHIAFKNWMHRKRFSAYGKKMRGYHLQGRGLKKLYLLHVFRARLL